jgi:hypothetical protein
LISDWKTALDTGEERPTVAILARETAVDHLAREPGTAPPCTAMTASAEPAVASGAAADAAVDDADQRADRHRGSRLEPRLEVLEAPVVHADLAGGARPWRAAPGSTRAADRRELAEQRFVDTQARVPEHDDQPGPRSPCKPVTAAMISSVRVGSAR